MIKFACPHCQTMLQVPEARAGSQVRCSRCQAVLMVPSPAKVPARPSAASPRSPGTPTGPARPAEATAPPAEPKSRKPGQYYYAKDTQLYGPVTSSALKELAKSGQLRAIDWVWKQGKAKWVPATKIGGLFSSAKPPPPPPGAKPKGKRGPRPAAGASARTPQLDDAQGIKVIAGLTETIRLEPQNARAYASRARAYLERGEYQKAVADYLHVVKLHPQNSKAFYQLGKACMRIGRMLDAAAPSEGRG